MTIRRTTTTLPKVYIGGENVSWGDVLMFAVAEDGEVLAEHLCSDRGFGRFDLHDRRPDVYEAKFGGVGDGDYYHLVCVETWSDVPQDVRDRNTALGQESADV